MTSLTLRPWPRSARRRPNGRAAVVALGLPVLALAALGSWDEARARTAAGAGWQIAQASGEGASGERSAGEGNTGEEASGVTPVQAGTMAEGAGSAGEAADDETPDFFEELDDLPLMRGLQEMPEASMAFDKPGGRIGEVYAEGSVPAEKVRTFYAETLPQFGWQPVAESRYERDGERLVLDVSERAGTTTLRISLSPTD